MYNISCDYVNRCSMTGCGYHLTGGNNIVEGMIVGDSYDTQAIRDYDHITVSDSDGEVVITGSLNFREVQSCIPTTGQSDISLNLCYT